MEGGFQEFPDDKGNIVNGKVIGTNRGVSATAYYQWTGKVPTKDDMKNMTESTAFNFYAWYFHFYKLYQIESQVLFELCANNTMGAPSKAAKAAQQALRSLGYDVAVDGSIGPQTISAMNQSVRQKGLNVTYNAIRNEWINYLNTLTSRWRQQLIDRVNRHFPAMGADVPVAQNNLPNHPKNTAKTSDNRMLYGVLALFSIGAFIIYKNGK